MSLSAEAQLQQLARKGDRRGYAAKLATVGPQWWFRMDLRRIAHYLEPHLGWGGPGLSPRLHLLAGAVSPPPFERGLERALRPVAAAYRLLHTTRDWDGAAMAAGLALAGVWDFGTDFDAAPPWMSRVEDLLSRGLCPEARAHLLAFLGLFRLFGDGDPPRALETLRAQSLAAHQAACPEMVLYGTALRALTLLLTGRPTEAQVVMDDAAVHAAGASPGSHARAYFPMVQGILQCGTGRPAEALVTLGRAASVLPPAEQPLSMRLQMASYQLMAETLVRGGLPEPTLETHVRELSLALHNRFHGAFLHFSLGTAYLRSGRPYRALIHADRGLEFARACHSRVPQLMNAVLRGQALAELRETAEAETYLQETRQRSREWGFGFFARAAEVELAAISLGRGNSEAARRLLPESGREEVLWTPFRDEVFQQTMRRKLRPSRAHTWTAGESEATVEIRTLGRFEMRFEGRPIFDRRWGSSRTLALLKLIVALGGHKVPTAELILDLWPDSEGDRGYANFKTALARLRRVVDAEGRVRWIHLRWGRVSLAQGTVAVDALAFEHVARDAHRSGAPAELLRAAELYQGDFLPQDDGWGAFVRRRNDLRNLYVRTVDALGRACLAGADIPDPLDLLARACALVPGAERLYARRMELFLSQGYPAEALRVFAEAEACLREILDTEPGPELTALRARAR